MPGSISSEPYIDTVIKLRAIIARYGERDVMAWWDDESLTSSGAFVMDRLFPRTAVYAQIETAIEAAMLRHRALVPQHSRMTLFQLPALLESSIQQRLMAMRHEPGNDQARALLEAIDVNESLADSLVNLELIDSSDLPERPAADERMLVLGPLPSIHLEDLNGQLESLARRLAAGYTVGSREKLVIPVYEMAPARA